LFIPHLATVACDEIVSAGSIGLIIVLVRTTRIDQDYLGAHSLFWNGSMDARKGCGVLSVSVAFQADLQ
jgi:hypothetical protein